MTTAAISKKEAVRMIEESHGKFIGITFIKRTTGEVRRMTFRIDVKKHLKGKEPRYDAKQYQLLTVWDTTIMKYRSIPIEGITHLSIEGTSYNVK